MTAIVHVGNVLDILPTLEAGSVNCVVTSPPYWGLRDYGTAQWEGGDAGCDHTMPSRQDAQRAVATSTLVGSTDTQGHLQEPSYKRVCGKCGATRIDSQLGLESTPELYVANMVAVFREVKRVLRDDGTLWLNLGDSYASGETGRVDASKPLHAGGPTYISLGETQAPRRERRIRQDTGLKHKDLVGIPWRVAFALQADGWYLRSDIIWAKPNPMPESVTDRPTKAHEYVFLLTKRPRYWYDADAINERAEFIGPNGPGRKGSPSEQNFHRICGRNGEDGERTRNKRTVWTIATQPYPEAHFATYPEKLVEPCVMAGCPAQVCSECGAPWERVTERTGRDGERRLNPGDAAIGHCSAKSGMHHPGWRKESPREPESTWLPTCPHDAATIPGTVLDPFTGSGTTGAVACRLGRNFVGIELSPEYAEMAERRIAPHRDQMQLAMAP